MKINLSNVEAPSYELAAPGMYTGEFIEVEEKVTKAGDPMLTYRFEIQGSENPKNDSHVGKPVFLNAIVDTEGDDPGIAKAIEIALENFKGISEAVGAGDEPDVLTDFLNKPLRVKVVISKSKDPEYDDQNSLKAFFPLDNGEEKAKKKPGGLSTKRRARSL